MPSDVLGDLSAAIAQGLAVPGSMRSVIEKLFGERYQKRYLERTTIRDAYALATETGDGGVPYAGLINSDNPTSGPFGGTSVDWFPSDHRSLIAFVVGTRGLAPDEAFSLAPDTDGVSYPFGITLQLVGSMFGQSWIPQR